MGWTPPSKFTVVLTFLLTAFGIFVLLDQGTLFWKGTILPTIYLFGFSSFQTWMLIGSIIIFFAWFLFFLGVKLKGF